MFDREMWKVVPAKTQEMYAGVLSNLVSVTLPNGDTYTVPIVVPSALFHYLYTFCGASVDRMTTDDPELFCVGTLTLSGLGFRFPNSPAGRLSTCGPIRNCLCGRKGSEYV